MKIAGMVGAVAIMALQAIPARASDITFNITGNGTGSLNGTAFSGSFDFTLTGSVADEWSNGPFYRLDPIDNVAYDINGAGSGTFETGTLLGLDGGDKAVYFSLANGIDLLDFFITPPADFFSSFGPIPGNDPYALFQFKNISTSGGPLTLATATGVQISANAGGAAPEPAAWAMLILGLGGVGASLRRGRAATLAST